MKKKPPKASDFFADFHSCGIFHRPFFFFFFGSFFFFNEFPFWENRPGRVTNKLPYWVNDYRRLSSAISTGSGTYAQMMSFEDSAIRIMSDSPPERFSVGERMEK
jgi:hypothetical protein